MYINARYLLHDRFSQTLLYYGLVLNSVTIGESIHFNFFLGGLVEVPAQIIAHLVMKYVGRKIPLFCTSLLSASSLILCVFVPRGKPDLFQVWISNVNNKDCLPLMKPFVNS